MSADVPAPSKDHKGENFPVASRLIAARHRPLVLAFYRFARAADDVADSAAMTPEAKLERLGAFGATVVGNTDAVAEAVALRAGLRARGLDVQHACDLLDAFRLDVTKRRYADWGELIDYCRLSAMPVGRFMIDVHGESRSTWAASDALCAALQIINHLQDCRKDFVELDRVYLPLGALAAGGVPVEALGEAVPSPALAGVVRGLVHGVEALLGESAGFAGQVRDRGLRLEVAIIHRLARDLARRLAADPFGAGRHHGKARAMAIAASAIATMAARRIGIHGRT